MRHRLPTLLLLCLLALPTWAQDRLKSMPAYERYQRVTREMTNLVTLGSPNGTWNEADGRLSLVIWTNGGQAFEYRKDGKRFRYDIATRSLTALTNPPVNATTNRQTNAASSRVRGVEQPERGRQFTSASSPDGQWKAFYRARNLWLSATNGTNEIAITTDGNEKSRVKFGTASWVYGEELDQKTAMWWSPDSTRIAFYKFDESQVLDYYLALDQTRIQDRMDIEPYVKAGATNPTVDIFIHDLGSKRTVRLDVRDGKPFDNAVVGHYIYGISWSVDGRELLFHRTNRRQNIMEFCAASPDTGQCRVIVREEWPDSWTENLPSMQFLKDGRRFLWTSERTGWKNLYLYDLTGKLLAPLTAHSFDVASVERVVEEAGVVYYLAADGDNPLKLQLHRVGLDGKGDVRLTDPAFNHSVDVSPDGNHFIDVAQTHDLPPVTRLMDGSGNLIAELMKSDMTRFKKLRLKPVELFKFKAADGVTDLYGLLHFPANFKSSRKHPLLVSVYAGPGTVGARETFTQPNRLTEYGFLVATLDSRSASGRGKRFMDAIYLKLGQTEIDDQAAGVKHLGKRSYVDRKRVGIFGTSYGGTVSATSLLRYPDVFHAAVANSPVTDYRNYDSIYAERYMWIPQENKAGYDAASVMTHATNLQGRLMLYYGTADNNVHPANSLQLIKALQKAGKSFELQVGPDHGHDAVNRERMMEFFIENLIDE